LIEIKLFGLSKRQQTLTKVLT